MIRTLINLAIGIVFITIIFFSLSLFKAFDIPIKAFFEGVHRFLNTPSKPNARVAELKWPNGPFTILFQKYADYSYYAMTSDGKNERKIKTFKQDDRAQAILLDISRRILYITQTSVSIMSGDLRQEKTIFSTPAHYFIANNSNYYNLSPDEKYVLVRLVDKAYLENFDTNNPERSAYSDKIYLIALDTLQVQEIQSTNPIPRGKLISFVLHWTKNSQYFIYNNDWKYEVSTKKMTSLNPGEIKTIQKELVDENPLPVFTSSAGKYTTTNKHDDLYLNEKKVMHVGYGKAKEWINCGIPTWMPDKEHALFICREWVDGYTLRIIEGSTRKVAILRKKVMWFDFFKE
jgi:hypothetical protein